MRDINQMENLAGKRVLVRIDTDVPLESGRVNEDYRLRASLPTIRRLRKLGASLTLIGHAGRPDGRVKPALSLAPVARRLASLLVQGSHPRVKRKDSADSPVFEKVFELAKDVVLLENLRFDSGEESNEPEFVSLLAAGHDYFVNESFATAHRPAASTVGITRKLPSYAGLRFVDEIAHLSVFLDSPRHPVCLIVGGAKMEEKLGLLESLLPKVDQVLVGGVLANMLLAAKGVDIKASVVESDLMVKAKKLLDDSQADKIVLPVDYRWDGERIADLGPRTTELYKKIIDESQTIFWAGSLGLVELAGFDKGSLAIAECLADHKGLRMVGGGDTAAAIEKFGLLSKMSFVSTGGGAALEFLAGKTLPAVKGLDEGGGASR